VNTIVCLLGLLTGNSPIPDIRLFVLDGGHAVLKAPSLMNDVGAATSGTVELADPCFLIKHGQQWLLWDTGLPDSLVDHPKSSPMINLDKARTMTSQLRKIGLAPNQVDYLTFSHMHYDHTGTAGLFASSTWILQRSELSYALSQPPPFSVVPDSFGGYRQAKKLEITGDFDVFGDGSGRRVARRPETEFQPMDHQNRRAADDQCLVYLERAARQQSVQRRDRDRRGHHRTIHVHHAGRDRAPAGGGASRATGRLDGIDDVARRLERPQAEPLRRAGL